MLDGEAAVLTSAWSDTTNCSAPAPGDRHGQRVRTSAAPWDRFHGIVAATSSRVRSCVPSLRHPDGPRGSPAESLRLLSIRRRTRDDGDGDDRQRRRYRRWPAPFRDEALYVFRFDTDGDRREDVSFKVRFGEVVHDPNYGVTGTCRVSRSLPPAATLPVPTAGWSHRGRPVQRSWGRMDCGYSPGSSRTCSVVTPRRSTSSRMPSRPVLQA